MEKWVCHGPPTCTPPVPMYDLILLGLVKVSHLRSKKYDLICWNMQKNIKWISSNSREKILRFCVSRLKGEHRHVSVECFLQWKKILLLIMFINLLKNISFMFFNAYRYHSMVFKIKLLSIVALSIATIISILFYEVF